MPIIMTTTMMMMTLMLIWSCDGYGAVKTVFFDPLLPPNFKRAIFYTEPKKVTSAKADKPKDDDDDDDDSEKHYKKT